MLDRKQRYKVPKLTFKLTVYSWLITLHPVRIVCKINLDGDKFIDNDANFVYFGVRQNMEGPNMHCKLYIDRVLKRYYKS